VSADLGARRVELRFASPSVTLDGKTLHGCGRL